MLGRPISLAAYCALGASAFLLPPFATLENDDGSSLFPLFELDPKSQVLQLPCSSCAWSYRDAVSELEEDSVEDGMFFAQGGAHNLLLNFTISEDGSGLLVNDHYIYPFEKLVGNRNMVDDMYISQVPASTTKEQIAEEDYTSLSLKVTGSGLTEDETVQADDNDLISLTWQLLSLEYQTMTVDSIFIQLLRTKTGELLILSIDTKPSKIDNGFPGELPPVHPHKKPQQRPCNLPGPFCAISDFVGSTFGSLHRGPCPDKFRGDHLPTHIRPHFGLSHDEHGWGKPWARPDSKPFDHPPFHGHRHGHHGHGFLHSVSRAILAVLIPIMAGITVGIVVCVAGLLFGQFLAFMWLRSLRGCRRGYTSVALEEDHIGGRKEDMSAEDEETLPVYEDALPIYEDAPSYESREKDTST